MFNCVVSQTLSAINSTADSIKIISTDLWVFLTGDLSTAAAAPAAGTPAASVSAGIMRASASGPATASATSATGETEQGPGRHRRRATADCAASHGAAADRGRPTHFSQGQQNA